MYHFNVWVKIEVLISLSRYNFHLEQAPLPRLILPHQPIDFLKHFFTHARSDKDLMTPNFNKSCQCYLKSGWIPKKYSKFELLMLNFYPSYTLMYTIWLVMLYQKLTGQI